MSARRSPNKRRGRVVMGGIDLERPDTMNSPITAAYVARHSTHTALRTKKAA
jgi:hypothetical protein